VIIDRVVQVGVAGEPVGVGACLVLVARGAAGDAVPAAPGIRPSFLISTWIRWSGFWCS
jgi:hypothetical protein